VRVFVELKLELYRHKCAGPSSRRAASVYSGRLANPDVHRFRLPLCRRHAFGI